MSIQFPKDRKTVDDRAKADVQSALPQSNPFLKNSFLGALITGVSGRVFEFYLQLRNALLEMFPDTATGPYLDRWGSYVAINRNPAAPAIGFVNFTGVPGTVIPSGTLFTSSTSQVFKTAQDSTVQTISVLLSSVSRSGTVATAVTQLPHNLASGMTVTIAGATPSNYDGPNQITVTDAYTFTYDVEGSPTTPATGTITASSDYAHVLTESLSAGSFQNQQAGSSLTVTSSVPGLDTTCYVSFDEIAGATDLETEEAYRARVLFRYQNPIALFNTNAIKVQAFKRAGVTRVWVVEAGSTEAALAVTSVTRSGYVTTVTSTAPHTLEPGQVITIAGAVPIDYNITAKCIPLTTTTFAYTTTTNTPTTPATGTITYAPGMPSGLVHVYFVRDNDVNNIPSATEVSGVFDLINEIRPAHVYPGDIKVGGPTPVVSNFTFTALSPNTAAMQQAISQSLAAVFIDETDISTNLISAAYLSAIWQSVDSTGAKVKSFTLSSTSDIVVPNGCLATLGTIVFPS